MKEINLSLVYEEAMTQVNDNEWDIAEWCGKTIAALAVTNIYATNDICRGFGQDFKELDISIISSPNRISLIAWSAATFVRSDIPICGYESLSEDIYSILVNIQACFDRLDR